MTTSTTEEFTVKLLAKAVGGCGVPRFLRPPAHTRLAEKRFLMAAMY
jgi:hypothetical protein